MPDLLKRGIDFTESLLLWPVRKARELVKGNPGLQEVFHITEDVLDLPFQMARKVLSKDGEQAAEGEGGPALGNIFVNPEVDILSDQLLAEDERQAKILVTGLICDA